MTLEELKNKKIVIVGAGRDGKATQEYLSHFLPNQQIDIVDQADGPDYLRDIQTYDVVIKSPGIKPDVITVPYTTPANIFFANVKGKTIGVTGTKGKSTTSSLIHAILLQGGLRSHLAGNIGNPMLSELLQSNTDKDIWVCELSSYMTGDLQYSPDISVILNLFPEHMDYHGTVEEYYHAKTHLLAHASKNDFFVYNSAFDQLTRLAETTKVQAAPFVSSVPFNRSSIPLLGEHNYDNVRAAITVGKLIHISDKDMEKAVRNFRPLKHRLEHIGTFHGITFYDDAISTTPQSTIQAIKTVKNIGCLLLGGQDRGYDFSELAEIIIAYHIPYIILFPESGERILRALKKITTNLPIICQADNTKDAISFAYKHAKLGTICLLSPASPSYSLWKNFEERGDEYRQEVIAYQKKNGT